MSTISQIITKIKLFGQKTLYFTRKSLLDIGSFGQNHREEILVIFIIILVAVSSFGLGKLSGNSPLSQKVKIVSPTKSENLTTDTPKPPAIPQSAKANLANVMASKNGTKYYFSWCGGVSRIAEKNKITFPSDKEAEASGYSIASGCKPR